MSYNCICEEGNNLPSTPNSNDILLTQLKREVDDLVKSTEAKLLCHDGKIAELCTYVKNNLSNSIRLLLDSMQLSGELDKLISDSVLTGFNEVYDKLDGIYSVKNFGANGNGLYDDTNAIKKALQFAEEHNGILFFNPGHYIITDSIDIHKSVKIVGLFEKGLTNDSVYGTFIEQINDNQNIFNFSDGDFYGVEISGIRLSGKQKAINIDTKGAFSEFIFEKIHFNGGFEECIYFGETGSIGRISDCDFSSNKIGINANKLVSVTINENNFWQNSTCHIKFGSCEDLRILNNWFEKTVETGCSLLWQAPFNLNKCIFLNNEFRSTKTPIIDYDGITNLTGLAYVKNTKFENCRFSVGSNDYVIVVRLKENGVLNSNPNNSSRMMFHNCLFVNVKTSAIFTDSKWLYWNLTNCECYSSWTSGNKDFVTGESIITNSSDISGYKTNGVIELEEIVETSLIKEGAIYKASDNNVKMFKYGGGKTLMLCLSGNTTSRPTENLTAGMMYFDTTVKKPIFYNGTMWVDSTGQSV